MFPRIALGVVGALVLSAIVMHAGTAAAKPITGSVNCELIGSATISPGLPLNSPGNATKKFTTKVTFNGTLSNCTGTQTNTKKGAQIDGGTVTATAKTVTAVGQPLPSCAGLATPTTPTVLKTTVKFTHGGAKLTSSTAKLTVATAVGSTVNFSASGLVSGGAFKGQNLTASAVLDDTALDFVTVCNAPGGLTTLSFTGVQGESTLTTP